MKTTPTINNQTNAVANISSIIVLFEEDIIFAVVLILCHLYPFWFLS